MLSIFKTILSSFVLILFGNISTNAQAYDKVQTEVYNTILTLFDGMRAGDSSMVHSTFSDDCRMYTNFTNKEGFNETKEGDLKGFLNAIGTPHEAIWDEKIWNTDVKVDMGIAQVWSEYGFFVGEKFSHCGIDAFQLINENGKWKIIQIIDTRKQSDCNLPK